MWFASLNDRRRQADAGIISLPFGPSSKRSRSHKRRVSRDEEPPRKLDFDRLAARTADAPLNVPEGLPCRTPVVSQDRFTDSPVYPGLETNVDAGTMSFSQEPIPAVRSQWSIERHGVDTPFRHHSVIRQYIEDIFVQKGYHGLVEYNTTVERAVKDPSSQKWELTLRRTEKHADNRSDYWWNEIFDAVIVASGHYAVPYIPTISGLKEFAARYPGSVEHTKHYRGQAKYRGKVCMLVSAGGMLKLTSFAESHHSRRISLGSRHGCKSDRQRTVTHPRRGAWSIQRLLRRRGIQAPEDPATGANLAHHRR